LAASVIGTRKDGQSQKLDGQFNQAHWQKGYAKEAGRACIDYAFNVLDWPRVVHTISIDNEPSIRTAEALGSNLLYNVENIPAISDDPHYVYGQDR